MTVGVEYHSLLDILILILILILNLILILILMVGVEYHSLLDRVFESVAEGLMHEYPQEEEGEGTFNSTLSSSYHQRVHLILILILILILMVGVEYHQRVHLISSKAVQNFDPKIEPDFLMSAARQICQLSCSAAEERHSKSQSRAANPKLNPNPSPLGAKEMSLLLGTCWRLSLSVSTSLCS